MPKSKVLCVAGPTASGKTRLAVLLAQRFGGEVVSVDSMQIYKGMAVGTAAPTPEEMEDVPHHMVGIADPAENWSVAQFTQAAGQYIRNILSRGKLPVLAGGTGLYLEAVVAGRSFAPGRSGGAVRQALQEELEREGVGPLLEELRRVDPESAARLHPNDGKRILRALEVYRESGKTISQHNRESQGLPSPYEPLYIGLSYEDREDLRQAICLRVDRMLEAGLLEEVRALLRAGVPREATAMQAIGYKELIEALEGRCSMEEAVEQVKVRSAQYAKRQLTWLRRNKDIHWIYWKKERDFAQALQNATDFLMEKGLQ